MRFSVLLLGLVTGCGAAPAVVAPVVLEPAGEAPVEPTEAPPATALSLDSYTLTTCALPASFSATSTEPRRKL